MCFSHPVAIPLLVKMPNYAAREAINLINQLMGAGKLGLTQQSVIYLESDSSSKNWLETWLRPVVNSGISGPIDKSGTLIIKLPAVDMASLGFQEIPSGGDLKRKGVGGRGNQEKEGPGLMTFLELLYPATSYHFIFVCFNLL